MRSRTACLLERSRIALRDYAESLTVAGVLSIWREQTARPTLYGRRFILRLQMVPLQSLLLLAL